MIFKGELCVKKIITRNFSSFTPSEEEIKQSLEPGLKVANVPGPNRWTSLALCNNYFNSAFEKGRLYSSSFLEEKSRRLFSLNIATLSKSEE